MADPALEAVLLSFSPLNIKEEEAYSDHKDDSSRQMSTPFKNKAISDAFSATLG